MPEEKTGDDCYKGMMNDDKDEIEVGVSAALLNFLNHPQRK